MKPSVEGMNIFKECYRLQEEEKGKMQPRIDPKLYAALLAIQPEYCWTIGATLIADHACSIWERRKYRDRGRIVINAHGSSFDEAVQNALRGLEERGPHLRTIANHL